MSLFKKIIGSFLLVSIIPITIFGILVVDKVFELTRESVFETNMAIAEQVGYELDSFFDTLQKSLESLSSFSELKNFDKEKADKLLDSYYSSYTIYYGPDITSEASPFESLTILDEKGIVKTICPLNERYVGLNYSSQSFFQEVTKTKAAYFSPDVLISDLSGRPIIKIAIPILEENGSISSIIEANIKLESLFQMTNHIRVGGTGYLFTVNRQGLIVTHTDEKLVFQRKNIEYIMPGLLSEFFKKDASSKIIFYPIENPDKIITYSQLEKIDWVVAVDQSLSEALIVPLTIRSQFILILFLATIFVGLIAFCLSRGITTPLKKLTRRVTEIGIKQELGAEIDIRTGDEIEELASSFNEMMSRLKGKTMELQKKTDELQERLEELNKWYRLTVGRELKMVELKKKILELEQQIDEEPL